MAIHDRWYKGERGPDGQRTGKQVRTAEYGCANRWQVRWRDETGAQKKQSFETKAQASQFDATIRTQLAAGTYIDPSAGEITLQAYAEQWRARQTHDTSSAERVAGSLRRHVYSAPGKPGRTPTGAPSIGDYPLRALARQPSIVQGWLAAIPLQPNTVRQLAAAVSSILAAAAEDGLISRNPLKASSVKLPKAVKRDVTAWSAEQVAAVAAALPARWSALAAIGAAIGARQGELFALAVSDIDFLRRTAHVDTQVKYVGGRLTFAPTKNRKVRDVPVSARVIPHLAEHVRLHPPVEVTLPWHEPRDPRRHGKPVTRLLLFTRPDGAALNRMSFNRAWKKAWKQAGIPAGQPNGCHVLRHTTASAWLAAGLGLARVAAYLGDTQEVILRTYSHFMPDDENRAREILDRFLEPLSGVACAPDVPRAAR
jgi:integrase